jgi:hypothetical protein
MARPRKPTNILELKGAFKKDPQRFAARENEPVPVSGLGDAPGYMTFEQKECFQEIRSKAHPGTMSDADSVAVEIAACLLAEFRADPQEFTAAKLGRLQAFLGQFGMTPADRSKVAAPKPKKENPFEGLMRKV